eukprot:6489781-Amphidinium_carterae.1
MTSGLVPRKCLKLPSYEVGLVPWCSANLKGASFANAMLLRLGHPACRTLQTPKSPPPKDLGFTKLYVRVLTHVQRLHQEWSCPPNMYEKTE